MLTPIDFVDLTIAYLDKAKQMKERMTNKKEQQIDSMNNDDVVNELKERKLPTFGTAVERKDRLKKYHGRHTDTLSLTRSRCYRASSSKRGHATIAAAVGGSVCPATA